MNPKNNRSILSVLMLGIATILIIPMLVSCGKQSAASPAGLNTQLNIINLSPDAFPVNFYIAYASYPSAQRPANYIYGVPSGYFYLTSQLTPLQIRDYQNNTIFEKDTALSVNCKYSLFITGLRADKTLSSMLVVDTDAIPTAGRGKVRFINTAARAVNVDVTFNGTTAFQNQGAKAITKYVEVPAGIYTFKLLTTGTSTVLANLTNITVQDGRLYTLYSQGIVGRTDTAAFGAAVITNK